MGTVFDARTEPDSAIDAAVAALQQGECIVLPTDTIYGIGADATNSAAVQRLLDAKERGRDMPPPVLIAEVSMLRALTDELEPELLALAEAFWPGALTIVLRAHPHLRMDLGDRGMTIAVRVPDHDFTRELLRATGPLAVSSANVSGQDPATTIEQAQAQLGERVAVYLDAGPAGASTASTIVDLTSVPRVLREGRVSLAALAAVVPAFAPEPVAARDSEAEFGDEMVADSVGSTAGPPDSSSLSSVNQAPVPGPNPDSEG